MKFPSYVFSVLVMLMLVTRQPAIATENEAEVENTGVFTLGDVVVTDEKDQPHGTVDRVDEETMRQFNRNDLAEALDLMPGVAVARTGARNERTVFVRGFDLKHVPLFMDGIPIYVMYDGYSDLGRFTTFDTSQIVVSKGAASVLYGPNTLGGAINVVTKRPERPFETNIGIGLADGDTTSGYANFGSHQGKWYIQGGASYLDRDYFNLSDDFEPCDTEDGDKRENAYATDQKISFKIGYQPNSENEYALSYSKQEGEKGTPPYTGDDPSQRIRYWRWPQWDRESYYFNSKTTIGAQSYLKTRLYWDFYNNSLFSYDDDTYTTQNFGSSFKSWYNDDTIGGSLEMGTQIDDRHTLKAAFHYKKDRHKEHDNQEPKRTFQDAYYSAGLEDTIMLNDHWSLLAGASHDWQVAIEAQDYDSDTNVISDFPTQDAAAFNPQIGLFYDVTDNHTIYTTIARKSRFPTLKDRYSYRMGYGLPNADLDPEIATNYEIGYKAATNRITFESALFYSDVQDYILETTIADPNDATATVKQNRNVGEVMFYGAEAQLSLHIHDNLDTGLNYTYTQWDNRSNSDKIIDIPAHKINVYAHYTLWEKLELTVDATHYAGRYSSSDGVRETENFTVVDAKAAYALINGLKLEAGVKNLMDENYEIEEGYPEAGASYFVNLTYVY